MTIANFLVNVLMVVLLGITIGYCWVLNRRIRILQDSKSELAQLLKHFDESTKRASESIIALQTASKKIGETIQARIDRANFLLDDLAFLTEKGGKLANQIEAGFAVDRARSRVTVEEPTEIIEEAPPAPKPVPKLATSREKTAASLEALLERVVNRQKTPAPAEETSEASAKSAARSRSEQELLELLKAGGIKG